MRSVERPATASENEFEVAPASSGRSTATGSRPDTAVLTASSRENEGAASFAEDASC